MTQPSITYGHAAKGFFDCDDNSGWTRGTIGGITDTYVNPLVVNGDIFELKGTCNDGGNEEVYYYKTINPVIKTSLYKKWLLRFKTSTGGKLGVKVYVAWVGGGGETLYGEDAAEFSDTWKTVSGDLTAGKEIDTIYIYADDEPDETASGTYYVWIDFLFLCEGIFEFPYLHDVNVDFPECDVYIPIPGRRNPVTQYIGAREPVTITLSGKIDVGPSTAWRGGSVADPLLKILYRIWQDTYTNPWQWLSIGGGTDENRLINCKVRPGRPTIGQIKADEATRTWSLPLKLYSLSNLDETTWANLQAFGI